jgi:hypothetical protein
MKVRYLFSSADGDIPVDDGLLSRPFLMGPIQEHPHLKLGDYFKAIERFVTGKDGESLVPILEQVTKRPIHYAGTGEIIVRSEKHGGLYHLASVEILGPELRQKFVVSTAATESSAEWLKREFETLKLLNASFCLPYLPEVYLLEELEISNPETPARLVLMLGQWFEDFHEWHLHRGETGEPQLVIWDFRSGYRRADEKELFEIFRQASMILTLYYNVKSTHQIYPWLHAAGDFIVKSENGTVDVRLTTARGYEPLMAFPEEQDLNSVMALVTFFLNLTVRMRLDRWEGVGGVAWAPDLSVKPTVEGFFRALRTMEEEGRYAPGGRGDFTALLKTFRKDELRRLCRPLMDFYRQESREMAAVIEGQLDSHCQALWSVIQDLPG